MLGMFKEQEVADAVISESVTGTLVVNECLRSGDRQITQSIEDLGLSLLCGKWELSE